MRIASLSPAVTEILFAIGADRHIVCIDHGSDFPQQTEDMPHVSAQNIDGMILARYKPETVFLCGFAQSAVADQLRKEQKFAVVHLDPRSLTDVYETIRQIGIITDCEERARALIEKMRSELSTVKRRSGVMSRRPKVCVVIPKSVPITLGDWTIDLVQLAGGIALPIPTAEREKEVSLSAMQTFDPDLIVVALHDHAMADTSILTDREGWNELKAVKAKRVFAIDEALLNRPGPRLVEGAQRIYGWIFQAAHQ